MIARRPRLVAWIILLMAIAVSGTVLGLRGSAPEDAQAAGALPDGVESARVAELAEQLPSAEATSALVVYSRDGAQLTEADRQIIADDVIELAETVEGLRAGEPIYAESGDAALLTLNLPPGANEEEVSAAVEDLRAALDENPDPALVAQVTGEGGFEADLNKVFDGADASLLGTTVAVVAILLLVTYRSPFLWLVPLVVVVVGDQVAASLITILARTTSLEVGDPASAGIASILVFGAGTNYALLLVARYREELRRHEDRFVAMRAALRSGGPAIIASAATVVLSLLTLLAAALPFNRAIGISGALGIVIALLFGLVVLPAALVVFGRWLFWPFVPRVGSVDPTREGIWHRVGTVVAKRPRLTLAAGTAVLAALTIGLTTVNVGLSQTEQFRAEPESVQGQQTLARYFDAGASQPLQVLTTAADAPRVVELAGRAEGVATAQPSEQAGNGPDDIAAVSVVLEAEPGTEESDRAIEQLRSDLDEISTDTLVGGPAATDYDTGRAYVRDQQIVIPLVLAVVAVVLCLLLRSVVAPALLILTVVVSYFAALGASAFAFERFFDFPALDYSVPLLAFLFLVALGVDYNIFLTSRAREEAERIGTRRGMVVALAVTGGVITSAGILLAAVFTVLGVLPLVLLGQLGIIVGFGVLLDTLLVRSLVVPALVELIGPRFWWPSRPERVDSTAHEEQLVGAGSSS